MNPPGTTPDVRLGIFEGPVELLLWLVRRNELDVFDVPIGRLTDDFLAFVRSARTLNLESVSDFLVMSGILVRLKMRALLPRPKEEDLATPTISLDQILDEFRRYQEAARGLADRETERRRFYPRPGGTIPKAPAADREELSVLTAAFRRLLERAKPERVVEVAPRKIRFEDILADLRRLLRRKGRVAFEDALKGGTITELIVMFIAVLELGRLNEITIAQEEQFGTIALVAQTHPAPGPGSD